MASKDLVLFRNNRRVAVISNPTADEVRKRMLIALGKMKKNFFGAIVWVGSAAETAAKCRTSLWGRHDGCSTTESFRFEKNGKSYFVIICFYCGGIIEGWDTNKVKRLPFGSSRPAEKYMIYSKDLKSIIEG